MTPNTYGIQLRDNIFERVRRFPFFKDFHFSKTKSLPIQTDQLPYCGIYFINELMLPDGDANVGEIRFRTSVRIGFSIIVVNNYADVGEARADQGLYAIESGLFQDPSFYINKIQAFTRGERAHVFGSVGHDNETPVVELQFDLTCDLGVVPWPPIIHDVFETLHIDARPMLNEHAPLVEIQWDIPVPTNGGNDVSQNTRKSKKSGSNSAAASDRRAAAQRGRRLDS
jgi:hypothetical protein